MVGETLQLLGSRDGGGGGGGEREPGEAPSRPQQRSQPASRPPAAKKPPVDPDLDASEEDDIPF